MESLILNKSLLILAIFIKIANHKATEFNKCD